MSTRQVAGLLAAAAPEVVPPRDTLRAVAPDRFTLKVSIDHECEPGLRLLKGLLSHRDPRMSWGDLVARVVREAVARHDPRGGGSGQRGRHNAGSAGASPRRTPNKTRAAGAAAAPAQRVHESSPRAPNRTRAAGAPAQRGSDTPAPEEKRMRRVAAPALPAQCACGATGAPHADAAGAGRRNPIAIVANAAALRQSAPAAPADDARAGGVPAGAPAAAAALQFAAGAAMPVAPVGTPAPEPAPGVSPDGGPRGASAVAAPGASAVGFHALLLPRRATPLADGLQMVRWNTFRTAASRGAVALAAAPPDLSGRSGALLRGIVVVWPGAFLPLPAFGPIGMSRDGFEPSTHSLKGCCSTD